MKNRQNRTIKTKSGKHIQISEKHIKTFLLPRGVLLQSRAVEKALKGKEQHIVKAVKSELYKLHAVTQKNIKKLEYEEKNLEKRIQKQKDHLYNLYCKIESHPDWDDDIRHLAMEATIKMLEV